MLRRKSGGLLGDDSSFTIAVPINDESKDLTTGAGATMEALAGFQGSKRQKPGDDGMSEASSLGVVRMVKPEPKDDTRSVSSNKSFKAAFKEISTKVHGYDKSETQPAIETKPRRKLMPKPKPKSAKAKHKLDNAVKREGKGKSVFKIKSKGKKSRGARERRRPMEA